MTKPPGKPRGGVDLRLGQVGQGTRLAIVIASLGGDDLFPPRNIGAQPRLPVTMPLHEHRTIVLPLALVERAAELMAEEAQSRAGTQIEAELAELFTAARDPDHAATKWARISAALDLPDDLPTLDGVVEAVERLRAPPSGDTELRQMMLDAIGDTAWTKPAGREPALADIVGGMREIMERRIVRLRAMASALGTIAGVEPAWVGACPDDHLIDESLADHAATREAIKRAGLGDENGTGISAAEAIDTLSEQVSMAFLGCGGYKRPYVEGIRDRLGGLLEIPNPSCMNLTAVASRAIKHISKLSGTIGASEDVGRDVLSFATHAEIQIREIADHGRLRILVWSPTEIWGAPERGETVCAGGKPYTVEAPGVATRFEAVEDIPF